MALEQLVEAARAGSVTAFAELVTATQTMVYAVARRVLHERADALDAVQEAYLRAYRGLPDLAEPAAFPGYLRRIAIRAAQDVLRARRTTFAPIELATPPALDEAESTWTDAQRTALARALVRLPADERLLTERFYHGGWPAARLAEAAGVSQATLRKRLQRIRDRLREEIEMNERARIGDETLPADLPARLVELLARPALVALPENPVGDLVAKLRGQFVDHTWVDTDEVIDLADARARLQHDPVYVPSDRVFQVDARRILRYDLTLPLALLLAGRGGPLRVMTAGKVYRNEPESATHLSAFHQLELLVLDDREAVAPWTFIGRVLAALDALVPGAPQRIERTTYPFCARAWDIGVEQGGSYFELLGCGVYGDDVVRLLGGDPARHTALGLGLGLERLAALHHGISDLRMLEGQRI